MPTKIYLLNTEIPHKLEICWSGWEFNPHDLRATLDGNLLGTVATRQELRAGQNFSLPDQSVLRVQYLWPTMFFYVNDRLLVDPVARLKNAYASLLVSAFGAVLVGSDGHIRDLGMASVYLYIAALFVVLAAFAYRRHAAALIAGIVLYLATLLAAYGMGNLTVMDPVYVLIFTLMLPGAMLSGIKGIQELKKLERCS